MTATPPHFTHPMHLSPMHPSEESSPSSAWTKDPFGPAPPTAPKKRSWWPYTRSQVMTCVLAVLPLMLHALALALLIGALLQTNLPYFEVKQSDGSGELRYSILNSCSIAPGRTQRICTPRSANVDFMPSILRVSDAMPGMSALRLPFRSEQTPAIFFSALAACLFSFLLYIPLWTLAYFPDAPLPTAMVKSIRFYSRRLFEIVGVFSFIGMIFTFTIGLGYKLLLVAAAGDFNAWILYASKNGFLVDGATLWRAGTGEGFNLVWASTVFQALATIGIKAALHNGLDERVEWPRDTKQNSEYWA